MGQSKIFIETSHKWSGSDTWRLRVLDLAVKSISFVAYRGQVTDSEYSGIFAFEGDWESDLKHKSSIRPNLETLRDAYGIEFVHRQIGTPGELRYYVEKWLKKGRGNYRHYRVGHFAFHGSPGVIGVGDGDVAVRLFQLERWINEGAKGRVIFFGSCSTIDISDKRIQSFLDRTKASAVVGFTELVDWLESAAFELLILEALTYFPSPKDAEAHLKKKYGNFVDYLGLTFHHA
jgi:hypothetical protein